MENLPESLKLTDQRLLTCLNNMKEHVKKIWDPPLLQHYTRHGIDHSQRIIDILGNLLKEHEDLLIEEERFILLSAVYLHDIGMQSPHDAGLSRKEQYTLKDSEIVREKHNETSAIMIRSMNLGLDLCKEYIDLVATLSEYHRKVDITNLNTESIIGKEIRLKLLAALLRLGDELDLDFRRINIDVLKMRGIPIESKFYWFSHHYVNSVQIKKGKIVLWFKFPENYKNNQLVDVFCRKIYESAKKQFLEVYDILDEYGLRLYRKIITEKKFVSTDLLESVPPDLDDYIHKNIIEPSSISKKVTEQSNVFWKIGGVLYSDDLQISHCLVDIFKALYKHQYDKAIKIVEKCQILTMASKERLEFSIVAGNCYLLTGNYDQAKVYLENVLNLSENLKLQSIYGKTVFSIKSAALGNLGILTREKGDFDSSIKYLKEALTISEGIDDKNGQAVSLGHLGILYMDKGDLNTSMDYLKKSIAIAEKINFKECLANNLGNIGLILKQKGKSDEASTYFKKSLTINKEIQNLRGESNNLMYIGSIYQSKRLFDDALENYNESLNINRKIGYKIGISTDLSHIGTVYQEKGDLNKALTYFQEAITIDKKIGYKIGEASNLNNIGLIYKQNNHELALNFLMEALEINEQINYNSGLSRNLTNIALVYSNKKDYKNAIKYLKKSLDIAKKEGYVIQELQTLGYMGINYIKMGNFKKALNLLNKSLSMSREFKEKQAESINLENIGIVYYHKKEFKDALTFLNQSLKINQEIGYRIGEASVLKHIGLLYIETDLDKSLIYFKEALNTIQNRDNVLEVEILNKIALLYSEKENYEEAFKNIGISISLLPYSKSYAILYQIIRKLIDINDWNNLKKIEIMYKSRIITDQKFINFFKTIREYSLIQLEIPESKEKYQKLYSKLDPALKIVFNEIFLPKM